MEEFDMAIVEGFSNETLSLLLVCAFVSLLAYIWTRIASSGQMIHPDQRATVAEARVHRAANERNLRTSRPAAAASGETEQCPICLDMLTMPIETNCGHIFCGSCIIAYWDAGSWLRGMNCPICRQEVSLLLAPSTLTEEEVTDEARQSLLRINDYNRRFSGEPRTLLENIQDAPVLFRHLLRELFSVNGLVAMFRVRVFLYLFFAFFYFISPLDLIPESVTGVLGFIDDIIVFLVVLVYVTVLYRNYVTEQ